MKNEITKKKKIVQVLWDFIYTTTEHTYRYSQTLNNKYTDIDCIVVIVVSF